VKPELKNGEYSFPKFLLELLQSVKVPGIKDERLFTDRIGPNPKGKSDMGVMKIIWRRNTYIVNYPIAAGSPELFDIAVKSLKFSEKVRLGEIAVDNPYGIVFIQSSDQMVPGLFDRLHVSGRDESGSANKRKIVTHNLDPLSMSIISNVIKK